MIGLNTARFGFRRLTVFALAGAVFGAALMADTPEATAQDICRTPFVDLCLKPLAQYLKGSAYDHHPGNGALALYLREGLHRLTTDWSGTFTQQRYTGWLLWFGPGQLLLAALLTSAGWLLVRRSRYDAEGRVRRVTAEAMGLAAIFFAYVVGVGGYLLYDHHRMLETEYVRLRSTTEALVHLAPLKKLSDRTSACKILAPDSESACTAEHEKKKEERKANGAAADEGTFRAAAWEIDGEEGRPRRLLSEHVEEAVRAVAKGCSEAGRTPTWFKPDVHSYDYCPLVTMTGLDPLEVADLRPLASTASDWMQADKPLEVEVVWAQVNGRRGKPGEMSEQAMRALSDPMRQNRFWGHVIVRGGAWLFAAVLWFIVAWHLRSREYHGARAERKHLQTKSQPAWLAIGVAVGLAGLVGLLTPYGVPAWVEHLVPALRAGGGL